MWYAQQDLTALRMVVSRSQDVSPLMGAFITAYVAFSVLAMMNVITGIFVENAATFSKEDKDHYVVSHVLNLFRKSNLNEKDELSLVEFQRMLETKELRELFQAVDVDVNDAESLFRLLDIDETGTLSPQELVDGWIRLRGPAKALDLAVLMSDNNRMDAKVDWICELVSNMGCNGLESSATVGGQKPRRQPLSSRRILMLPS
ncbi:SCN4A [Symbiodinium natans]|uniref:SCN4A protein n=1 Tax=Symbiodinium natans TaxID=878477 RepID=A0A812R6G0_9DINO|nr:SCN4A [Symbiodinium natans]